jgi:hypothetical protein
VKSRTLMAMSLFALLAVTLAYGQLPAQRSKVPFKFNAGEKTLPAGEYQFIRESQSMSWVTIRGTHNTEVVRVKIITLLAREGRSDDYVRIVFDKVGQDYFLSEVWLPGSDGLLVGSTKGEHQHEIVKVQR